MAAFERAESALVFNTGYMANVGTLAALVGEGDALFSDQLNHASLIDGCRLSKAHTQVYPHADVGALEKLLAASSAHRKLVCTDTVFSMDGDVAPLSDLVALCRRHGAALYVDEAHATGVLGPRGMGLAGLAPGRVDLVMGTFSKALGSMGGYVAGSRALCDYLVGAASGFVYTTAPPPPVLGAVDAALELVPGLEAGRTRLQAMAEGLRGAFAQAGIDTAGSTTQIVPALVGGEAQTLALARAIQDEGFLAVAIRPPTVPEGSSRIRFALSAAHGEGDIERLGRAVARLWPRAAAA